MRPVVLEHYGDAIERVNKNDFSKGHAGVKDDGQRKGLAGPSEEAIPAFLEELHSALLMRDREKDGRCTPIVYIEKKKYFEREKGRVNSGLV